MTNRLVYGVRPVEELLRSKREVAVIYTALGERSPQIATIAEAARARGVGVTPRERAELDALTDGKLNQGVVAVTGEYRYFSADEIVARATAKLASPLILVLDGVQDPQNLGALIRSAHILGADGIVLPKDRAAQVTAAVVKASAGATEHTAIAQCTNVSRTLEDFKQSGIWTVAAVADGGEPPWKIDFRQPTALVLGAEGKGVRPLVARTCDLRVKIPMAGQVASLNVAAAGAMLLYEALRQRSDGKSAADG
jgi:23S rRNA (guanosine2251-2'-O)-methyltransferase